MAKGLVPTNFVPNTETHNLTGKNSPKYPKVVIGSKHRGNRPELHLLQMWWEIIQTLASVFWSVWKSG